MADIGSDPWVSAGRDQHNKLIIGINDDDVRQMVESKIAGKDPAELVRQKIEDFRLGI